MSRKEKISIGLIIATHIVGVIGFSITDFHNLFLYLTPFNLLLAFFLVYWGGSHNNKNFVRASSLIYLLGFGVEVLGVKTGLLFGEYSYGEPLGVKLFEVPLIIGVNWFILTYGSNAIASLFLKNLWFRIVFSSILMVGLDILIEPVAIDSGFWTWESDTIPLQNYIMWFITSLFAQFILEINIKKKNIKIGVVLFVMQLVFFLSLNILS